MAIQDSKRLNKVIEHLYPNLDHYNEKVYILQNDGDGNGSYIKYWNPANGSEPTDEQIANAKEEAIDAFWWKILRQKRDQFLSETDQYAVADRPAQQNWVDYRQALRDLPTTATKPSFEILNSREAIFNQADMDAFFPTKP
tara:strand:+ start:679 stop:1101 length:423 start_codon:yes stop_codon:yes gene_type:complete